eukprot:gene5047-6430_t
MQVGSAPLIFVVRRYSAPVIVAEREHSAAVISPVALKSRAETKSGVGVKYGAYVSSAQGRSYKPFDTQGYPSRRKGCGHRKESYTSAEHSVWRDGGLAP